VTHVGKVCCIHIYAGNSGSIDGGNASREKYIKKAKDIKHAIEKTRRRRSSSFEDRCEPRTLTLCGDLSDTDHGTTYLTAFTIIQT